MSEMVLFVGTYDIREGGLEAFYAQAEAMTQLIREHEPRVLLVGHYLSDDQTEGTSIHLHPDPDSFEFHMQTASRMIEKGKQAVAVKRIEFYGKPPDQIVAQLSEAFDVRVKAWADGYSRISD
ncbi:MAG: hypothetical protein ACR2OI_04955 [Acidimicrobiia bacterium]